MAVDFTTDVHRNSNGNVYVDASDVVSGLYRFANFTRAACRDAAKDYADWAEAYMQKNAPWNDVDTPHSSAGDARKALRAEYFEQGVMSKENQFSVGVRLSHGVWYGVFLEYNGLYHKEYLKRRRPILVPMLEKQSTSEFLDKIRVQFAKIARYMR